MKSVVLIAALVGCIIQIATLGLYGQVIGGTTYKNIPAIAEKEEDKNMTSAEVITWLVEHIHCGERTASSLEKTILNAGVPDIKDIALEENRVYTILKINDSHNRIYYVMIGLGYTIEEIRLDSIDGLQLYFAMQ